MLEIMGKGYVIDHCMSFFQRENLRKSYQYYVTDLLMGIARAQGLNVSTRFKDIVDPVVVDDDPNEIINRIKSQLGGGGEK